MNFIWFIIIATATLLYFSLSLILVFGLNKKYQTNQSNRYSVSVLVAARNEAENIPECLASLAKIDYPEDLLEIIIINDRSEDETQQIITDFIKDKPCFKYKFVEHTIANLSGKASAISQAIGNSRGEIIFITDADCTVSASWVQKVLSYFSENTGLVAGFTLLNSSTGFFNKLQNLDWAYLLSVAAGSMGVGIPLTCIGNNFAFRRCVYDEVGGYEGVGFSVTEDFALLKTVAQKTSWKIIFPIDPECLIRSKPVTSVTAFFSQRKRWATGGKTVHWFGKILIATSFVIHLSLLSFTLLIHSYLSILTLLFIILLCDWLLLKLPLTKLNASHNLKYLPIYKLFFWYYSVILLLKLLVDQSVTWKGIKYSKKQ